MKSAAIAVTALAAVANAYSPGHHMHFPRANTTTTAPGDSQTTLTVIHTQVSTVISCAPTVTNCPAGKPGMTSIPESDRVTSVVTNTVELTKTVCPVSEAGKVSSSVISDHNAGKITGTPISATETAAPASTNSMTTITTNKVHEKTITITMGGPGGSSAVPTVVRQTVQETVVVPCSETASEEPTTTTTATSTMTRTVTVQKPKGTDTPSKPGNSAEACKDAPTVTVTVAKETVTVPASTVFVTVPCDGTQTGAASPAQTGSSGIKDVDNNKPVSNDKPQDKPQGSNNGGNDEDCPPDVTTTKQHTVTVVPVPYPTNGTTTAHHRR